MASVAAILHALAATLTRLIRSPTRPALDGLTLLSLAASCTPPAVTPAADDVDPVVTQPRVDTTEVVRAKAPSEQLSVAETSADQPRLDEPLPAEATPERTRLDEPLPVEATPERPRPIEPLPAEATPWGSPLDVTGKSHGLRFTTTAQVERTATALQLAIHVELHNATRAPMKVSLHPPLVTISTAPVPGSTGEGLGLGLRGEGFGSDVCSPGHGGPTTLPPGGRASVKRTVELDPLPWPRGQAYRVTATSRDCRPDRLSLEVLDVLVVQPASPDGVPSLLAASPAMARK